MTRLRIINKLSGIVIASALLFSCNQVAEQKPDDSSAAKVQTFRTKDGWAYSIFLGKKEFIRQLYIPCIQGQTPFETNEQAMKAGTMVLQKLKNHELPSLTLQELEENHLLPSKDANKNK